MISVIVMIDCIAKSTVARVCKIARTLTNVSKHPSSELHWLENISIYDSLPNQIIIIKQESRRPLKKLAKPWTYLLFLFLQIFLLHKPSFFSFIFRINLKSKSWNYPTKGSIIILLHKHELQIWSTHEYNTLKRDPVSHDRGMFIYSPWILYCRCEQISSAMNKGRKGENEENPSGSCLPG